MYAAAATGSTRGLQFARVAVFLDFAALSPARRAAQHRPPMCPHPSVICVQADASKVSTRAKKRGLPQLGTLGAGNHYCEIQVCRRRGLGFGLPGMADGCLATSGRCLSSRLVPTLVVSTAPAILLLGTLGRSWTRYMTSTPPGKWASTVLGRSSS